MKVFVLSFLVLLALSVESAQSNKNSNLAVMLAYRPNSEIRTRDKSNDKYQTYQIDNESAETLNDQLLEALIKDRFAQRYVNDDKKNVKRENTKEDDFESHESHESADIDDAKVVQVRSGNDEDKKTCYKKTYKNVLNAFESALKSQIENYKKCVCQKKTTTTTTTTTTEASTPAIRSDNEESVASDNEETLASALNNRDDIVCFHKQHAFMLSKLLDRIPCKSEKRVSQPVDQTDMKEFNGEEVKRAERNNNQKHSKVELESESIEIDVSDMTPKPKSASLKPAVKDKISTDENEALNEKILALLKEHLSSRKSEKVDTKKTQRSPKKIVIRPRQAARDEESEESPEISQHEFIQKLQELFHKYQPESDETFQLQSGEHSAESTSQLPPRKSPKKSEKTSRYAVAESSDESTEAFVKLKNRKLEKERLQLKESSRKTSPISNHIDDSSSSERSVPKKSYRNSPRTTSSRTSSARTNVSRSSSRRTDDETDNSAEEQNVRRNHDSKNSYKVSRTSRPSVDDRLAADLAKKISDFARGKSPKKD